MHEAPSIRLPAIDYDPLMSVLSVANSPDLWRSHPLLAQRIIDTVYDYETMKEGTQQQTRHEPRRHMERSFVRLCTECPAAHCIYD
jgi:predicted Zn-dependent protease